MIGPRYRAHIIRSFGDSHRLYIAQDQWGTPHESGQGIKVKIASGFTWNEHCEGDAFYNDDGIPLADDLIQAILDRAWESGFRPHGFSDIKNETSALRDHLSDLRKISFKKLGIKE